jgi:CheY-like chemotaxis protein
MIFVELIEAALASNKLLNITINVSRKNKSVLCNISVSATDFNIPTILLSQVQKDGVLARLVNRSGAQLGYDIEGNNLSLVIELEAVSEKAQKSSPPNQIAGDKDITKNTRGTILIVDDDPAIVRSTRRVLEKDYDILASTSANDAIKIFESGRKIDVIILDIFMPETTGIELVKLLKNKNESIEKSIIFITGGSADQEISAYLTETSIPMVEKPIDIDVLQNHIHNIMYK